MKLGVVEEIAEAADVAAAAEQIGLCHLLVSPGVVVIPARRGCGAAVRRCGGRVAVTALLAELCSGDRYYKQTLR